MSESNLLFLPNPSEESNDSIEGGDLASQLLRIKESGALKTKTAPETPLANQNKEAPQEKQPRGGRGSKIVPGSLKTTIQNIRKEEGRIKSEEEDELKQVNDGVKELNAAHTIFASNIATLKNKLSKNPIPQEEKRLNIMLSMARDHMSVIEKILPINTEKKSYDSDALKIGIVRFKEYEEARRKQMLAEINQLQGKISEEEVKGTRRKANYLYGEIFELTKQEEGISSQEKNIIATEISKPITMSENYSPRATEQSAKLNQEALDLIHNTSDGVPAFMTANLKKIAKENGISVLPTDTPNSVIERLRALDNSETIEPAIKIEPTQPEGTAWQDEAIARFESEGGKVLEVEPEVNIEKEYVTENTAEVLPLEEAATEKQPVSPEAPATKETKVETAEEKKERILGSIYKFHNVEIPERAKKAGMSEKMLDVLRAGGEVYKELPLKKKLIISLALFGTAWVAGGTIASIAMGGSLAQRALGGMATFVAAEGLLKASAEKDGRERGEWEKRRHTAEALIAGFIVGGGYAGQAFQNIFSPVAETIGEVSKFYSDAPLTHVETPVHTEALVASVTTEKLADLSVIKQGEGFWQPVHNQLALQHPELNADELNQKTQELLIKNNIIHPDGSEVRVSEVGARIQLNPDNTITYDHAKTYEAAQVFEAEARQVSPEEFSSPTDHEVRGFEVPVATEEIPIATEIPTAEAEPVITPEKPTPNEVMSHPDSSIKVGNTEGTFKYSPDGKVAGFTSTGTLEHSQVLEAKKILNDGWRGIVLSNNTGISSLNTSIVESRASEIYQYEQLLKALEGQGGSMSPEADYFREQITNIVTDTEKTYGDVFKEIGRAPETVSAIPMGEQLSMPQEINPQNPEIVAYSSEKVHNYVNSVLGKDGFLFGIGAVDGMKTPEWLDFANRPIDTVMNAEQSGAASNETLNKMQGMIQKAITETGVTPAKGETVEKFLNRAAASTFGKIK